MSEPTLAPKRVTASTVTLTQMMEVTDANIMGNVHGGVMMRLVDTAAALAAFRHAGRPRASRSRSTRWPSSSPSRRRRGDGQGGRERRRAHLPGMRRAGRRGGTRPAGKRSTPKSAYLVFVALDEDGRPRPVPPLVCETEDEQRRQREAKLRRGARLAHAEASKPHGTERRRRVASPDCATAG